MLAKRFVSAHLIFGMLCLAASASGQTGAWFGSWHLNLEQSSYAAGPPYKRGTWRIERHGEDVKMIYDLVGVRGGVTHMEWTGRFDGRPYTLQGPDAPVTYAYTQADPNRLDLEVRVDGAPNVRGRIELSPDGRTITATTMSRNAKGETMTTITVYDRR